MQTDEHMVANETLVFSEKKIPLLVSDPQTSSLYYISSFGTKKWQTETGIMSV